MHITLLEKPWSYCQLIAVEGWERLAEGFCFELYVLGATLDIESQCGSKLGLHIIDRQQQRYLWGAITHIKAQQVIDDNQMLFQLSFKSAYQLLDLDYRWRVFHCKSVKDIVTQIAEETRLNNWLQLRFCTSATQRITQTCIQHQQSTRGFIDALLADANLSHYCSHDSNGSYWHVIDSAHDYLALSTSQTLTTRQQTIMAQGVETRVSPDWFTAVGCKLKHDGAMQLATYQTLSYLNLSLLTPQQTHSLMPYLPDLSKQEDVLHLRPVALMAPQRPRRSIVAGHVTAQVQAAKSAQQIEVTFAWDINQTTLPARPMHALSSPQMGFICTPSVGSWVMLMWQAINRVSGQWHVVGSLPDPKISQQKLVRGMHFKNRDQYFNWNLDTLGNSALESSQNWELETNQLSQKILDKNQIDTETMTVNTKTLTIESSKLLCFQVGQNQLSLKPDKIVLSGFKVELEGGY